MRTDSPWMTALIGMMMKLAITLALRRVLVWLDTMVAQLTMTRAWAIVTTTSGASSSVGTKWTVRALTPVYTTSAE